jgi:hypothetical protein
MIRFLFLTAIFISLSGCAGMLKSSFAKKYEPLGVSTGDIESVDRQSTVYYGDYQRTASQKFGVNDQMLQTQVTAQMTKITNIFCTCVKKLGDKCQSAPNGLTGSDKEIWIKGNGAAEALTLIQKSQVDAASCPG